MKPRSILDPAFKYVPAASTDIRQTFRRIRREQKAAAAVPVAKVVAIKKGMK